jgi:hypothetical protein
LGTGVIETYVMSEDSRKLLEKYREDNGKRSLSNTENYDRSILTLSSAMLGFSLAFIRDLASVDSVECRFLLPLSWVTFLLTIVTVLISFRVSESALEEALKNAEKYYRDGDHNALSASNIYVSINQKLNFLSGVLFTLASLLTIIFVSLNFSKTTMKNSETKGATIVAPQSIAPRSATIPTIQSVTGISKPQGGATVPAMQGQPAPATAPAPAPATGK